MEQNSYWLAWRFNGDRFLLIDWASTPEANQVSKLFWPAITLEQAKDTVLLECHEKGIKVARNIENQELPKLPLQKLPFKNVYIVAEPRCTKDYGDFVECTYWFECLPEDRERDD